MAINQQTAAEAYKVVLDNAGAILPDRDAIHACIVKEAREVSYLIRVSAGNPTTAPCCNNESKELKK